MNFDDLLSDENSESVVMDIIRDASNAGVATSQCLQMEALKHAMDSYAKEMDLSAIAKSTGLPNQLPVEAYKGFVAEEFYKNRLKINALAEGVPDYKLGVYTKGIMPDGTNLSQIDEKVDIAIWVRKHFWSKPVQVKNYQSKMFNNASKYEKVINDPKYQNVDFVGGSGQGVNDKIRVKIAKQEVSSDAITPDEARALAGEVKAQSTPAYEHRAEKIRELNTKSLGDAVKAGALVGFTISTIKEIITVIKNRDNLSEDQFVQSIENILCGTAEGAIRGGAINISVQLMGKMLGKELTSASLEAVPAMALANFSVDLGKDLYRCFVKGSIDTDDLLCNSVENMFSSVVGFTGAWVGGQVAGQIAGYFASAKASAAAGAAIGSSVGPIGTIIGAVVGGVVFGIGAHIISSTANKDAQKAFKEVTDEINSHIELSGFEKLYYFADSMGSLSEHKLSFKDLLPCYNLISDLREYNYHKKAIKGIKEQLNASIDGLEKIKTDALLKLELEHQNKLKEMRTAFIAQRDAMRDGFVESLNTYASNSYIQYLAISEVNNASIAELIHDYEENMEIHSSILDHVRYKNRVDAEINQLLNELLSENDSRSLLEPFINRIIWVMTQEKLMVGKQYVSYSEAISCVSCEDLR